MSSAKASNMKWKETRHDKWYHLAKEQGFRSRAAFKLLQLNKKFDLLNSTKSCLDLCAAPGGWLQVAHKYMPVSSLLIGIDLAPIKPLPNTVTIQADILTPECRSQLKAALGGWDLDLVLHDGAPNVSGGIVWSKDAYTQNELTLHACKLACEFLRPGGTFVTKIFRSSDYNALLFVMKQLFGRVTVTKPVASRLASAEIYVVCQAYSAPKTIDPKMFDPQHVFQQFDMTDGSVTDTKSLQALPSYVDVMHAKPGKTARSRQGYDDVATQSTLLSRTFPLHEFVAHTDPLVVLGSYHSFTHNDETSKQLLSNTVNPAEILTLISDLKVLSKGDFKTLLKWRKQMKEWQKALAAEQKSLEDTKKPVEEKLEESEDEEAAMDRELEDIRYRQELTAKKEKRKQHEMKMKAKQRLVFNAHNRQHANETMNDDDDLFNLKTVSTNALETLEHVDDENGDYDIMAYANEEEHEEQELARRQFEEEHGNGDDKLASDNDDEDAYIARLEQGIDGLYADYKKRRKITTRQDVKAAQREEDALLDTTNHRTDIDDDEDEAMVDTADNPLIVELDKPSNADQLKAKRWFSRDIFKELNIDETTDAPNTSNVKDEKTNSVADSFFDAYTADASSSDDENEDGDVDADVSDDDLELKNIVRKSITEVRKPLVGAASMSKTAEQIAAEEKAATVKARLAAKKERQTQRKRKREEESANENDDAEDDEEIRQLASDNDPTVIGHENTVDEDGDRFLLEDLDSKKKAKRHARIQRQGDKKEVNTEFEEVAMESDYSSDEDAVATTLAMGHHLLTKAKRDALLDNSYNRFAQDRLELVGLPSWFIDEESHHSAVNLPVSKAEIDVYKSQLKAINARPIKKIAEARLRKKKRTEDRWLKLQKRAESIEADETKSDTEKLRQIESIYNKKSKKAMDEGKKKDRRYLVAKKGGGAYTVGKGKGKIVRVDKRMKKDKRGAKASEKRNKQHKSATNKRRKM